MQYELFYLVGEAKESQLDQIKEDVKKIVESEGGKWLEPEIIEKRKMAYKIKAQFRGIYVARRFELPEKEEGEKNEIQNISKKIRLNPGILRFLIVRADELPELKPHETIAKERAAFTPARKREFAFAKDSTSVKASADKPAGKKAAAGKEAKSIDEKLEEILNI